MKKLFRISFCVIFVAKHCNNFVSKFCQIWLTGPLSLIVSPLKLGLLSVQIIGRPQKVHCDH